MVVCECVELLNDDLISGFLILKHLNVKKVKKNGYEYGIGT